MLVFTNVTGAFFNRCGKLGLLIKQLLAYQTSQYTNLTSTSTGVVGQYASEPDLQALTGQSYIGQLSSPEAIAGLASSVAQVTASRMVYRDNALLNQNLVTPTVLTALQEIIRQMKVQGATILSMTITLTPNPFTSVGTNTGNAQVVMSSKRAIDGLVLENSFGETLTVKCTRDSYTGGASAGNETYSVTGQGAEPDLFAFDWPLGSNCSTSVSGIDGSQNNSFGNLLTNSGFDAWTGSVPNNFVINVGGSLITEETGLTYDSGAALKITGDGVTLVNFAQQFNSSLGTLGTLSPLRQSSFGIWMRRGGVATTGQLAVELIDNNSSVISDAAGTPNQVLFDLSTLGVSYAPYSGSFRTPLIMPSSYSIRFRFTPGNALNSGGIIYLDLAGMGLMKQLYVGGPSLSVHSGSTPPVFGDYAFQLVANGRGAGGTLSTWQTLCYQLFPQIAQNELLIPSSLGPNVSDGLIA